MDIWVGMKLVPKSHQGISNVKLETSPWPITIIDGPWYDSHDEVEKWLVLYNTGAVELWVEDELRTRFKEQGIYPPPKKETEPLMGEAHWAALAARFSGQAA